MPKPRAGWRAVAVGCLSLLLIAAADAPPSLVAFSTAGGDAWSFEKEIAGTAVSGRCDRIEVKTPAGTAEARPSDDGRFTVHVRFLPGPNALMAECRQGGRTLGAPARQTWNVRLADRPKALVRMAVADGPIGLDASPTTPGRARAAAIVGFEWRARPGNPALLPGLPARGPRLSLPVPAVDGEYYVTLHVTDAMSRTDETTVAFRVRDAQAEAVDTSREHAAWVDRAVVYSVVPSLLGAMGLQSVIASLDRIAALGANTLLISPITVAPPGDFGYAVVDAFRVDPRLGTAADLRALVAAAHARHLRVLLDLVANHLSDKSSYFEDAARRRKQSPYFSYFARDGDEAAAHYFDWRNLENLNYDNPEVRQMMIAASARWIRDFDVDGFRVDAAWGPRERRPDFWSRWSGELKRIKPDILLLAEAPAADPYYLSHGFAAAYDWTAELGHWAWRRAFDDPARTATDLRTAIGRSENAGGLVYRFLNNNDTGARFVTRYGVARTRVAAAMLLTLPGIPSLFMGDEVGAAFEPYHPPAAIDWSDRAGLAAWYQELVRLRREHPALRSPDIEFLDVDAGDQVLGYIRRTPDRRDAMAVLLNYGSAPVDVRLPEPFRGRPLVDVLEDRAVAGAAIPLGGHGVRILSVGPAARSALR